MIFDYLMTLAPTAGLGAEIPLTLTEVRATKLLPLTGAVSMRVLARSSIHMRPKLAL